MGPFIYTEPIATNTLRNWLERSGDLFVELYKPHSGAGGDYYIVADFSQYVDLMERARAC